MSAPEDTDPTTVRWVVGIIGVLLLNLFVYASWGGTCTDYVNAPGVCTSGPTAGRPGAVVISLSSMVALGCFAHRLRRGRSR